MVHFGQMQLRVEGGPLMGGRRRGRLACVVLLLLLLLVALLVADGRLMWLCWFAIGAHHVVAPGDLG